MSKPNSELTPADVKAMPLDEFESRFGFVPIDALEKWGFAMQGKRMGQMERAAFSGGIIDMPDLSGVVMDRAVAAGGE